MVYKRQEAGKLMPSSLLNLSEGNKTIFGGALNYRIPVFAALSLITGIVVSAALYQNKIAVTVCYVVLILFLIAGFVLAFFRKRLFVWVALFLLTGFFLFNTTYSLNSTGNYQTENAVLTGRVSRVEKDYNDYHVYLIKDVRIDGKKAKGNAYMYTTDVYFVGTGVSALGTLDTFDWNPFDYRSMSYQKSGVKHTMYAQKVNIITVKQGDIFERIREKIKHGYETLLSEDSAGIALSLVLGDKSLLPDETNEYFKTSGLLHIFSVSGLHIGFLVAVISFICRNGRIGRYTAYGISFAAMVFYAFVTGFAPSIVRAIVMTSTVFLGFFFYRRTDSLNSIAIAAIIILLFSPISLFDLGFQLSFTAVLGIVCFYTPIKKRLAFGKGKITRFVSNSFALSLSANSILFAVSVNAFSTFGIYFCLSNLLVIPLVSMLYAALMLATFLFIVFPFLGALIGILDYPLLAIKYITQFIAGLPNALAETSGLGFLAIVYVCTLVFMSKYFMVPLKTKYRTLMVVIGFSLIYAIVFL